MHYHSICSIITFFQIHNLAVIDPQSSSTLFFVFLTLLILSFIIGGSEVAYFSLTTKDLNVLKTKQQNGYRRIINLLEEPKVLLGSFLIASSFVNIAIVIVSNILIGNLLNLQRIDAVWLEYLIKFVVISVTLILFGEVMPKVMAAQNNIRFAKDVGPVIEFIYLVFKRGSIWLVKYSDVIARRLNKKKGVYSLEELDEALDLTTNNNTTDEEKNILKGILKFGNITVKQIMKTRVDVLAIDKNLSFTQLIKQIGEWHYSRIPVFDEHIDKIVGLIHTKDLLPYINRGDEFVWMNLTRPPYFVHEHKFIEDLLNEFQTKHIHFAVVVDEFGGTSGIVTLEDIMEEVIGEIKDEFDEEEIIYKKIDDHNYIFEGKTMLNDVCKAMHIEATTFDAIKGESDSLAGLVLEIEGEIPPINQIVSSKEFDFTILEAEKNRLLKIKVTINQQRDL